jgi:PRC-barrel domain/Cysteine rich repeat
MANISRTIMIAAAFAAALSSPTLLLAQSAMRDRAAASLENIESGCKSDIENFCGNVARGEGRVLLCMQAHDDQLSRRCQLSLYRASRGLKQALHRVERIADNCWTDIQARCANADKIGQCVVENRNSLSRACRTVVATLERGVRAVADRLKGLPVFSSDDKPLGKVVQITRRPDNSIQSIDIELGRVLGLGSKLVTIDAERLEELADRVRLRIPQDEVKTLPTKQ